MRISRLSNVGAVLAMGMMLSSVAANAARKTCSVSDATALQTCIDTGAVAVNAVRNDSLFVNLARGTYSEKITIRSKKNVWLIGDTVGSENNRPVISYLDTSSSYKFSESYDYSGALLVDSSRFVTIAGLILDGGKRIAFKIEHPATYIDQKAGGVEKHVTSWKGNNALSIRRSWGVRTVRSTFRNAWRGVLIRGENLGGASAYPNPQDDLEQVRRNLPTSNSGLYGRHLIERCRLYDNTWGVVGDRDWDLGSVFRYNEFYDNYVRVEDKEKDPWNQSGGAFMVDDVAITPYRIHNNSFFQNGVTFGGYYKAGTQHLFYNNLVGKPIRYHRDGISGGGSGYTQTERATEMLKYFSEHQRANLIEPQDDQFSDGATVSQFSGTESNFSMFRTKNDRGWADASKTSSKGRNPKSYSMAYPELDSLNLTWIAEEGTKAADAKVTGGKISRIRQNMWVEAYRDPADETATKGYGFAFLPKQIKKFLTPTAGNEVFRDVSNFDVWWTTSVPFSNPTDAARGDKFLKPKNVVQSSLVKARIQGKGWKTYSGYNGVGQDLGALSVSSDAYAFQDIPQIEVADTLVEMVHGDTIEFPLNVFTWNGVDPSKLKNLRIVDTLAKFYRSMPVTDTVQNSSGRQEDGSYQGTCNYMGGLDGVNTCRTQVNSVLDSMPWPEAVKLTPFSWVNDSLKNGGVRDTRYQFAGTFEGGELGSEVNYARAEIVMAAEVNGVTVFSNPGVFIYAKPRYKMNVKVLKADCSTELTLANDGMSRRVMAGETTCMQVQPAISEPGITDINFKPLFADYTPLMGADTAQMRLRPLGVTSAAWSPAKPGIDNDFLETLEPGSVLGKDEEKSMDVQFRQAGIPGRVTMRAMFNMVNGVKISDLRSLQGTSPRILVVPNTFFQATIDTVIYDTTITAPNPYTKGENPLRPTSDSTNVTYIPRQGAKVATVVLHVRDAFANILSDSLGPAQDRGIKVKVTAPKNMVLFDSTGTRIDSVFEIGAGARIVFRGVFPSKTAYPGEFLPLVSTVIGIDGGVNDTTWIRVPVEAPKAPKVAAYYDRNGDGSIDSVAFVFDQPLEAGSVIEVGDPTGRTTDVRTFTIGKMDSLTLGYAITPWAENFTAVVPGTMGRIKLGEMVTEFPMADSAAPVILSAGMASGNDRTGKTPDTLLITASEPVTFTQPMTLTYKVPGDTTSKTVVFEGNVVCTESGSCRIDVNPLDPSMPVVYDSLRFTAGPYVKDASGTTIGSQSNFVEIENLRPRILEPLVGAETPVVKPVPQGNAFELLTREPSSTGTPGASGSWSPMSPGFVGDRGNPSGGRSVLTFSSNMPATVNIFVYDNMGVFVNDFTINLTKEVLASAKKSRLGEATLGFAWNGTTKEGALVSDGVYIFRFVVKRDLTGYEIKTLGNRQGSVENYVVKVGINTKLAQ